MDLSKHMLFQSVRLVGAVGIEPTTFGLKGRSEHHGELSDAKTSGSDHQSR
jgi:hypothetical protein